MTLHPMDQPHATETASTPNADRFLVAVAVDGEVLFAGPSVPSVLGVERETLVGDDFLEHVHPSGRKAVSDALSAVAVDRRVVHRVRHASGGYVRVESVVDDEVAPEFGGRVVTSRRVDGTFPERYRAFLEYGTDIVTVVDDDGRVRYESPSVEEVLGYEQGSLVGRSPLGYVHPDDRDRVTEEFYGALSDPDAASTLEYRYRTADDDWVWLESRTRSLPDDAAVGRLVINSRDVTERKHRERRLADRNDRLDRFTSIVSHDLRNPLSVVRASIEMARHRGETDPLERGERAVDRIERLTTELLTLARQGEGIDDPSEFPLERVAREAWDTVGTADADLVVGRGARIRGDRSRLRQALENLFRNCVEHGGPRDLRVVVTATDRGFVVADDGPGIDPDHESDVFESGFTTREDGTGYGLDIVRGIVEAHDWSVALTDFDRVAGADIDRPAPDGACFEIRAPTPKRAGRVSTNDAEGSVSDTADNAAADNDVAGGDRRRTWIDR
ncbi:PAS domain S-box-containing protein [Halorubrum alkaliphilum]|uniref:histidine kinase n=2 Tax=Halorubrum alkaliphilum TaxID=261290 RepID=A0A8T4GDJ0_9EURY|nr:PAS domain S-box-containing protein [Halorubrum alkaliphilum]